MAEFYRNVKIYNINVRGQRVEPYWKDPVSMTLDFVENQILALARDAQSQVIILKQFNTTGPRRVYQFGERALVFPLIGADRPCILVQMATKEDANVVLTQVRNNIPIVRKSERG